MKKSAFWMIGLAATGAVVFAIAKQLRTQSGKDVGQDWLTACDDASRRLQAKLESLQKAS